MSDSADTITGTVVATNRAKSVVLKGVQSTPLPVTTGAGAATVSAVTRVAVAVVNTTLLAVNATRRGAIIHNNSATALLFVKLGAVAAIGAGVESFTYRVPQLTALEIPYGWTGIIDGIWDVADAAGEALMTELT